uniref:beta-N-acetylhexosaminidase n=1 Tax=Strombidium inclinatum TaxID=197538 RepID=A0A7S3ISS2_9SPIT|mmetsp:Transcript_37505/g.57449  ORF Transcript_37505/g.57449 Transcript_37505/m.57449 type:complete len:392 (+) Transcript_37505:752-1927(+)
MSQGKLNVLHIHLSDTGSWPMEIDMYPEFTKDASYRNETYTRQEIRDLVQFAKERGVKILPEIDMPGHSPAHFDAPEITAQYGPIVQCTTVEYNTPEYCFEPPAGQWNISNPNVTTILLNVLTQLSEDFSTAPHLHIGADEVNTNCSAVGTAYEHSTYDEKKNFTKYSVQAFLENILTNITDNLGMKVAMWQDSIAVYDVEIDEPEDVLIQIWSYHDAQGPVLKKYCQEGSQMIQSATRYYYLDCGDENPFLSPPNFCTTFESWKTIYLQDIITASPGMPEECDNSFTGASVQLWSEKINKNTMMAKLFPRALALAERLWSNPTIPASNDGEEWIPAQMRLRLVNDFNLMNKCLEVAPMQPEFCLKNPAICDEFALTHGPRSNLHSVSSLE